MILLASSLGIPAAAFAVNTDARDEPIVVTGTREPPPVRATSTATRTETDLKDIPQAISIVGREQIDDAALRSIGEVLRYVPGALIGQGEGHRDQVTLRGNSSTADFFVDGLRDDVQYHRGLYNVERIEVLKGPNAMIVGRGVGGQLRQRLRRGRRQPAAPLHGRRPRQRGVRGVRQPPRRVRRRPLSDQSDVARRCQP